MYSVIVVDDEASVRERIVSFLRKEAKSFRLLGEYENGYDALMYGVPQGPDLIITDVKSPSASPAALSWPVPTSRSAGYGA